MPLIDAITAKCADPGFRQRVVDLLIDMCTVDTAPNPDVTVMRDREAAVFARINAYLGPGPWRLETRPVDPAIADHPAFSKLHFTKTPARPAGLSPEQAYAGRGNLLVMLDGQPDAAAGTATAINAHIDIIAPFIAPVRDGDTITGRGTIDDKGHVAAICGALKLIAELIADGDLELKNRITAMFPIEEETGGNGSLALALDRELRERYDSILVMECASRNVFPANRGAVWFRCEAALAADADPVSLAEAVAYGVLAMQETGATIKRESDHPLFPHRPVQTCNGILGPFGEHPSRINGRIECRLTEVRPAETDAAIAAINRGIERYVADFDDKTQRIDPTTGLPKVDHHLDLHTDPNGIRFTIHGSTGHMGAILDNDDAILKWAYCVRELVKARPTGRRAWCVSIPGCEDSSELILEGGQGFLPTHPMEDVQARMRDAFADGVAGYLSQMGFPPAAVTCATTYDKLHNAAFAGDPDSPTMRNARAAAIATGMLDPATPIRGWDVSCDARLFATEFPEMPVVTAGIGDLTDAHSDHEHVRLADLFDAVIFCAVFLLQETGSAR